MGSSESVQNGVNQGSAKHKLGQDLTVQVDATPTLASSDGVRDIKDEGRLVPVQR